MTAFFRKAPFVRLLLPFLIGLILGFSFKIPDYVVLISLFITFLLAFSLITLNKISKDIRYQWLCGISIHVFLIIAGAFIAQNQMNRLTNQVIPTDNKVLVAFILKDYPEEKAKSYQCMVKTYYYLHGDTVITFRNKVILYFQKAENVKTLKPGDILSAYMNPSRIKQNNNSPEGFDYAAYLLKQGIMYSAYIKADSWRILDRNQLFFLNEWAIQCRDGLLKLFCDIGFKGRELGVLSALTIGYKADLDQDIKQAYSATGAMHILAVSGMHVGLIYIVLGWLFGFMKRIKYGIIIKGLLLIFLVWYYAFLTGLSPSVLRASVMITFVGLGQLSKQKLNVYNSLAIAAFVLLVINPVDLMDVGFQLSFLAVLGIVSLYPIINGWVASYKLVNQIWSLVAVSLSAQLATFPLSLYYFQQFPNYFLLANLIVVPLATLVIYGSICLIVISGIKVLLVPLGTLLYYMVHFLNEIVIRIEGLPFSTIQNINLNAYELAIWYGITLFVVLYFLQKKATYLFGFLAGVLCLLWIDVGRMLFY